MDNQAIQKAEKIDRFLQGKMTHEEHKAFEYLLAQDANLREALENTDIARQAIRHHGLRMEVKDIREQMLKEKNTKFESKEVYLSHDDITVSQKQRSPKRLSFYQYSYRVAAGLALVFVSFITVQMITVSPEGLYASKMELNVGNDVTRGKGESASQTALRDAYQQNNFEQLINLYDKLNMPNAIERYFAAAAYLQLEQYDKAIDTYQQILEDSDEANAFLLQESNYKLALTYIRQGAYDEAMPILENLDEQYAYYDNLISGSFLWKLKLLRFKDELFD